MYAQIFFVPPLLLTSCLIVLVEASYLPSLALGPILEFAVRSLRITSIKRTIFPHLFPAASRMTRRNDNDGQIDDFRLVAVTAMLVCYSGSQKRLVDQMCTVNSLAQIEALRHTFINTTSFSFSRFASDASLTTSERPITHYR